MTKAALNPARKIVVKKRLFDKISLFPATKADV
jgi:hypothetical protein